MPASSKGYSALEDADASSRAMVELEENAMVCFLEKIDHLLAGVLAALILCIGFIAFGHQAQAATRAQRMQIQGEQRSTGNEPCQPGMSYTTTRGSVTTFT